MDIKDKIRNALSEFVDDLDSIDKQNLPTFNRAAERFMAFEEAYKKLLKIVEEED